MVDTPRTQKKVVRQGNSLTLRPPAAYLAQLGLREGSPVTFILEPGRIVVEPGTEATPTHDAIVKSFARIGPDSELAWGRDVGPEVIDDESSRPRRSVVTVAGSHRRPRTGRKKAVPRAD